MLKKEIMAYVHQLLDQPSQWQTSQQAGPCSVPKFTNTSITVKHLLIKNKNTNQSKSSLLIWHYVSYLFLLELVYHILPNWHSVCSGKKVLALISAHLKSHQGYLFTSHLY